MQVELRYASARNFVGSAIDGYEAARGILTRPAAVALQAVHAELSAEGLGLKVFDAYRPQRAVLHFIRWSREPGESPTKPEYYPGLAKSDLFTQGYLALESAHSRGSAVDVTLVHRRGDGAWVELDLGTGYDFFAPESAFAAPGLQPAQRANRRRLRTVMEKHGFVGSEREWWHFTLRDEPYPSTYYDFPIR